jgi:syntaxin 1B/2/3
MDMAVLLGAQDEAIEQVGENIQKTVEYTGKGVEELKIARKRQKKSRRLTCLGIFCLIVALVVIGVVVFVVFKK